MIEPAAVFQVANLLALLSWIALAASLWWPAARATVWPATGLVIPALVAVAYLGMLAAGIGAGQGGGFGSIPEVRALFASDAGLTAGWLHYIAFDLFVGTWIAREGATRGMAPWLVLPCLALCFLFGPAGLLLFLILRRLRRAA